MFQRKIYINNQESCFRVHILTHSTETSGSKTRPDSVRWIRIWTQPTCEDFYCRVFGGFLRFVLCHHFTKAVCVFYVFLSVSCRERAESPPPRSFFYRVLRAAFPLHLLLLLLLLLPCLIPLSESDPGCTVTNNFARSFYPMLHYTNGPPPVWQQLGNKTFSLSFFFFLKSTLRNTCHLFCH